MKVGFVGCGNMGRPMAMNIMKGGYELYVNDVVKQNTEALVEAGAKFLESPKAIAETCDLIFTSVPNGKILKIVELDPNTGIVAGLKAGKIVIDMSTVAPSESKEVADKVAAAGCDFLRAPVTGSTVLAESAALGVFCSGPKAAFDTVLPLFKCLSNNQHYLGDGEQARALKLAINIMIAINAQMLAEATILVDKAGLDRAQALEIIGKSAAGSPVVNYKKDLVVNKDYKPAFSVMMMEKDLDLALASAKDYGIGLPLTSLTRQFLGMAEASGHGGEDFAYLVQLLEDVSGC